MIGVWDYYNLVGGFKHFLFSIIYGIIHPIDWDGLLLGEYIYILVGGLEHDLYDFPYILHN